MNEMVVFENNKLEVPSKVVEKMRELTKMKLETEMLEKELKEELLEAMEANGIKESFETNGLKVTYKKATTRTTLDSKKVKEELPEIFEKYSKTSEVKSSISLEFLW